MRARAFSCTLLLISLAISANLTFSQTPQGFNYQAVIRDGAGNPIASRNVALRITLQDQAGTNVYYVETHQTTSSSQGVISLSIGNGTLVSGLFSNVQWKTGSVYIKVEIDPIGGTTFTAMGTATKLQSVPYALYAENGKEVVSESNASDDDPIFVVKNKAGKIVFAVYQTGVRVYVEDATSTKGARSGFAVGGLTNQNKATEREYFRITPDSARIYIKDTITTKGARGGFAVGGLTTQSKGVTDNYLYVHRDSSRIYFNETSQSKGARGGFAVGGLTSQNKESANSFFRLTPKNYFIGQNSGQNITTGLFNSTLGYESGINITSGGSNAFMGYQSGFSNRAGTGNLFLGYKTGYSNVFGNYNSFLGYLAGNSNTIGTFNTFLGSFSGYNNTVGYNNTFVGDSTGYSNVNGYFNTFVGTGCGRLNTSGDQNVFLGNRSGYTNSTGNRNVFIGNLSGYSNTTGFNNIMIGSSAGRFTETGQQNIFIGTASGLNSKNTWGNVNIGYLSGFSTTDGSANVFIGGMAGYTNTTGFSNTFIGIEAGYSFDGDYGNTFLGDHAGYFNKKSHKNVFLGAYTGYNFSKMDTASVSNVFIGNDAGYNSTGGYNNIFMGYQSGYSNVVSYDNVFIGTFSGYSNTSSSSNVFIGRGCGYKNTTGSDNVFIGVTAGEGNTTGRENVFIGWGTGVSNTTALGNVFVGAVAGEKTTTGEGNTFVGLHAGQSNTQSNNNTVVGAWTADTDSLGSKNTLIGASLGRQIRSYGNTILGFNAGPNLIDGYRNIFIGYQSGFNETGSNKLYISNWAADSSQALIWGDFDKNLLRFNGKVGINGNPIDNALFSIYHPAGKSVLAIKGTGDPYNFAQIKLISDEATTKYFEINHSKSNKFGIVYFDGTNWNPYFDIDSQGKTTIKGNSPLLNIYPNSGALGRKSTIEFFGTFGLGTITDYGSRSLAQIQAGCNDNDAWAGAYLRILGITPDGGSASELMRINTENGNVGIGTIAPDKKLHVEGDARISGSIYYGPSPSSAVYTKPDFVFKAEYDNYFDPLKVDEFIKTNGHLPWLTAAKDEKDGVNLTRMQFETVETVENLQLQIIEMKKEHQTQIQNLENKLKEVDALKTELETIKALLKSKPNY
ncbi:MAG: hypothetical protein AB9846_07140 [Tenuifilaceae bacterium]